MGSQWVALIDFIVNQSQHLWISEFKTYNMDIRLDNYSIESVLPIIFCHEKVSLSRKLKEHFKTHQLFLSFTFLTRLNRILSCWNALFVSLYAINEPVAVTSISVFSSPKFFNRIIALDFDQKYFIFLRFLHPMKIEHFFMYLILNRHFQ